MAGGGEGFVDGGLHRGQFGARHAGEVQEVQGGVDEGDVEVWDRESGVVSWGVHFSSSFSPLEFVRGVEWRLMGWVGFLILVFCDCCFSFFFFFFPCQSWV